MVTSFDLHIVVCVTTDDLDIFIMLEDNQVSLGRADLQKARHRVKVLVSKPSMRRLDPHELCRIKRRINPAGERTHLHGHQSVSVEYALWTHATAVKCGTKLVMHVL
jgi:hypothetical protein